MATRTARVLVVDDSVVIRKILTDVLRNEPDIEVAGTASNGVIALAKLDHLKPDLVTLDIEMPDMGGLETLAHIRRRYPRLPVIMISSLTEKGAGATLDALSLGASDYITKPTQSGNMQHGVQSMRDQLVPKIRALTRLDRPPAGTPRPPVSNRTLQLPPDKPVAAPLLSPSLAPARTIAPRSSMPSAPVARTRIGGKRVEAVVIGASTGGPNALAELWAAIDPMLPVPVMLVQHMPHPFTTILAERLDRLGSIHTVEATDGMQVLPGTCWLAPGGRHMVLHRTAAGSRIQLNDEPPQNSCRPSVDPLFRSAAAIYGAGLLAVVLTGMGTDGAIGASAVHSMGGQVIVQDEESSVVWGMPGAIVAAGLADAVLPLGALAAEINRRVATGRVGARSR